MANRGPMLPVWNHSAVVAGDDEANSIKILCSPLLLFYWLANFVPKLARGLLGFRGDLQEFRLWLDKFSNILLTSEYRKLIEDDQDPRQNFLQLKGCRRLRSGAVLFFLYLFAQQYRTEEYSDKHFREEADAATELRKLIEKFEQDASPHLARLKTAPGLWPDEAGSVSGLIQAMKETAREPGSKWARKSIHRSTSQTLLRLSGLSCGYLTKAMLSRPEVRWRFMMWILRLLLGPKSMLNGKQVLSLAKTAGWAAGKWISLDALKRLYYEDLDPASEAIERHVQYHLCRYEMKSGPEPETNQNEDSDGTPTKSTTPAGSADTSKSR